MSTSTPLDHGIDLISRAIQQDQNQNYEEAYSLYKSSLEYLILSLKHEQNPDSKTNLQSKINEYLTRAETIKNYLTASNSKPQQPLTVNPTSAKFLERGLELAQQATNKDQEHNYVEAFKLYQNSLDYLMLASQFETNTESKTIIGDKLNECLTRAEVLKVHLNETMTSTDSETTTQDHLTHATDIIKEAIFHDKNHHYLEASKLYQTSLGHFMLALKREKNEQSKAAIRTKITEYLTRAEKIKVYLTGGSPS